MKHYFAMFVIMLIPVLFLVIVVMVASGDDFD